MYVCVHYDLFITRVCDGVWKHSFGGYLVLLHSSLITKINSIYKSTLRYRLQWKHVESELINCLFYLREKLDNIFFNVPKSVGGRGVLYWKKYTNCINKWILVMVQSCKYSVNITAKQYGHMLLFIVDMKFIYLISVALIFFAGILHLHLHSQYYFPHLCVCLPPSKQIPQTSTQPSQESLQLTIFRFSKQLKTEVLLWWFPDLSYRKLLSEIRCRR